MKIALIFPPMDQGQYAGLSATYPPLGLLSIASCLEKEGHTVRVYDCSVDNIDHKQLKELLAGFAPDAAGVSVLSANRYSAFKCVKAVKELNPATMTILGGVHVTYLDEETCKKIEGVDVIVRGEGEATIVELFKASDLSLVKGITYKSGGKVIRNPDRPLIEDIDSLPLPAFHLVPMEKYFANAQRETHLRFPASLVMTSRGCMAKCIFCTTPQMWPRVRIHSPAYVIKNIQHLQKNWGVKDFIVFDDTFPLSKSWLKSFAEEVKANKIDMTFRCLSRVNAIDDEVMGTLKSIGCYFINFGIESGSDKILKVINKNITVAEIRNAFALAAKHKIMAGCFLMVGFPEETEEDLIQTLELVKSIKAHRITMGVTEIHPGTKLYFGSSFVNSDFWTNRALAEKNFANKFLPTYEHQTFSLGQMDYYAGHIVYYALLYNFFNVLYFTLKFSYYSKIRTALTMVYDLVGLAGRYSRNPFKNYRERTGFFLSALNLLFLGVYKINKLINIKKLFAGYLFRSRPDRGTRPEA